MNFSRRTWAVRPCPKCQGAGASCSFCDGSGAVLEPASEPEARKHEHVRVSDTFIHSRPVGGR